LSGFVVPMLNCMLCGRHSLWILAAWASCGKMLVARPKSFIALQMACSRQGETVVDFNLHGMGSSLSVSWSFSFSFFFFFLAELLCGLWSGRNASSGVATAPLCSSCSSLLGSLLAKLSQFFHHVLFTFGGEQICFFSRFHAREDELFLQIKGHWTK